MSDERVRELQRRFQETGSPEDELAFRRARLQHKPSDWASYERLCALSVEVAAGHLESRVAARFLTDERLAAVAYCGHPPARRLLGPKAPLVPEDMLEWIGGLRRFGTAVELRVCRAFATVIAEIVAGATGDPRLHVVMTCFDSLLHHRDEEELAERAGQVQSAYEFLNTLGDSAWKHESDRRCPGALIDVGSFLLNPSNDKAAFRVAQLIGEADSTVRPGLKAEALHEAALLLLRWP